jgi:hypothetical protein
MMNMSRNVAKKNNQILKKLKASSLYSLYTNNLKKLLSSCKAKEINAPDLELISKNLPPVPEKTEEIVSLVNEIKKKIDEAIEKSM